MSTTILKIVKASIINGFLLLNFLVIGESLPLQKFLKKLNRGLSVKNHFMKGGCIVSNLLS